MQPPWPSGADYMKYDECYTSPLEQELFRFFTMRDAMNATGRPMVYTICPAQSRCDGTPGVPYDPYYWKIHNMSLGPLPGGDFWDASSVSNVNMCRGDNFDSCDGSGRASHTTTACSNYCGQSGCTSSHNTYENRRKWADESYYPEDIAANWCSFNCLVDANIAYDSGSVAGPGHWVISDMLEVGNGMSVQEDESHFTLWCMMSWPLMMGHDIRNQTEDTLRILTNDELLQISADPMGRAAKLVGGIRQLTASTQVYLKQLENGDYAATLFNRGHDGAANITLQWAAMWMPSLQPMAVRDLWLHKDLGIFRGNFSATVPSHGVVAVRLHQLPYQMSQPKQPEL